MAKNTEIELKLLISKENLKKMLALDFVAAAIRAGSCKKRKLISSYYDTEDLAFKRNGIAYRVRSKGDGTYEATVKTTLKNSAGLSERLELNLPLANSRPKLEGFAELGLGYELTELAPAGINKLFTVNVQRTTYLLDLEGAVAELAIDHGRISTGKSGDAMDVIDEIEIELIEGEKGALLDFAAKVAAELPLFVEKRSKFVRGLALLGIASDGSTSTTKLGTGLLKDELMLQLAQHGEALLELQKQLLEQGATISSNAGFLEPKLLKGLYRELLTLRVLCKLAEVAIPGQLQNALAKVENLRSVQALWCLQVKVRGKAVAKQGLKWSMLSKKLDAVVLGAFAEVLELAQAGGFTAIVYALNSSLYSAALADIGADAASKNMLKQWQKLVSKPGQELKASDSESTESISPSHELIAEAETADDIWVLARIGEGKAFAKAYDNIKKERQGLLKAAQLETWQTILAEICAESTSKLVYRDVGIILGYLLKN